MNETQLAQAIASALKEHGNGNGKNGAPWWSKSIWMLGPVAIIAIVLVAQNAGLLKSPFKEDHMRIIAVQEDTNSILRIVCLAISNDPYMKSLCSSKNKTVTAGEDPLFPFAVVPPAQSHDDAQ